MQHCSDYLPGDEHELIYDLSNLVTAFAQSEQAERRRLASGCSTEKFLTGRVFAMIKANRCDIWRLFQRPPLFYKNKLNAEQRIEVDDEIMRLLPEDFFKDPTGWIESQPNIGREDEGITLSVNSIRCLLDSPYDVSKVKEIKLESVTIISKRISDPEEIVRAMRAYNAGIPTPRVLGVTIDKGNVYAFFEKIDGLNLNAVSERRIKFLTAEFPIYKLMPEIRSTHEELERNEKLMDIIEYIGRFGGEIPAMGWVLTRMREVLGLFRKPKGNSEEAMKEWMQSVFDTIQHGPSDREIFDEYFSFVESLLDLDRFVGFNIAREMGKLEAICHQKGIHHKDFNYRNIVMPWDFENDRPVKLRNGESPRLYVVDWESPVDPEYDPIKLDFLWLQFKISWEIFSAAGAGFS